jgi:predicted XRE-type DNA-binding protein
LKGGLYLANHVKVSVNLNPETIKQIELMVNYSKVRSKYTKRDLPLTTEDFIKSAINDFLDKCELIHLNVISEKVVKLSGKGKLKNNIKKFLEDNDLKQKNLCELTGLDPANISYIVSNKGQPSMDYFLRIWVGLDCPPIEELFYRDPD